MSFPELKTTDEMAALLRKSPEAFRKWASRKHLKGYDGKPKTWNPEDVWNAYSKPEPAVRRQPRKSPTEARP